MPDVDDAAPASLVPALIAALIACVLIAQFLLIAGLSRPRICRPPLAHAVPVHPIGD